MSEQSPEPGVGPAPTVDPLDLIEHGEDLPVSETVPSDELQALLEAPTGIFEVEDEFGVSTFIETDPVVPPGGEFVAPDPSWLIAIGEAELETGGQEGTVFEEDVEEVEGSDEEGSDI